MNPHGIYATTSTRTVGFTTGDYSLEFSNKANVLSWDGDMSAYALGYINPDQLPNSMAISKVFITEEENVDDRNIVIQRIKPTTNAQIAFVRKSDNSCSYVRNDDGTVTSENLSGFCFINNLYPEFVASNARLTIYIKWFLYVNGTITDYRTPTQAISFDGNDTYYSWLEFKNGRKLTINFGQYGTVEYGYNDFENGRFSGTTSTGAQVSAFFVDFTLSYSSVISGYGSSGYNYAFSPLLNYSGSYEYGEISGDLEQSYTRTKFGEHSSNQGIALYQFTYNNNQGRLTNIYDQYGYGDDVFNVGELKSIFMSSPKPPIYTHIYKDSTLVVKESNNDQVTFFAIRDFDEIDQCLALYSRFTSVTSPPVSYLTNKTYCCDVDANNKFSIHFKTGDINDAGFKAGLQPWQYIDRENDDPEDNGTLNTNDFDPTDPEQMPPYTPEPPTPEGEEGHNPDNPDLNLGITEDVPGDSVEPAEYRDTSITFPISAFLTQYVLDSSDIFQMANTLWSGLGDPNSNMVANIARVFTSTGTLNISNVMDFFVSVKMFPFDIASLDIISTRPAMTIGTGAVPLLNYTVNVINRATAVIECGTVNTLQEGAFKLSATDYDFRNYINCTYTVFLPFCGNVELNPADVFPYELSCRYFVDFISGSCTACVYALRENKEVLVASKTGQIGKIVPITASNVNAVVGAALTDVSHVVQTVGSAIVSAATSKALGANMAPVNEASKNADYLRDMVDYKAKQSGISAMGSGAQAGVGMLSGAVGGIGNMMSRSGINIPSLSGGTGLDALHISKRPYLAIRRLNYCSPNQYAHTTGFAGTDGSSDKPLRNYQGWTVLENPDLSNIKATQEELSEIKYLLETGVYV